MGKAFVQTVLPIAGMVVGNMLMPGIGGMALGGALGGAVGGHSYGGGTSGMLRGAALGGAGGAGASYLGGLGSGAGSATAGGVDMGGAQGLSLTAPSGLGLTAPAGADLAPDLGTMSTLGTGGSAGLLDTSLGGAGGAPASGQGLTAPSTFGTTDSLLPAATPGTASQLDMSSLGSVASPDYSISSPGGLSGGDTGIGFTPTASGSDSFSLTGDGSGSSSLLDKLKSYLGELGSAGKTIGKVGGGLNILSGLYGLTQANKVAAAADPFAPYRSQYATQLSALEANPSSITSLPGYAAGLQAVQRAQAAQGYTGSGNAMNALAQYGQGFYNQQVQQLAALAGAGATPGAGAVPAANITSSSLGTIGLGAAALLKGA